jgi:uncharacterized phiE125 gp8 family phage protein
LTVGTLPVSLATAKAHLRVLHNDDDTQIGNLIAAGVEELEQKTGRAFSAISAQLSLSEFPDGPIAIPRPPLVAVSSITYATSAGSVTLPAGDYTVDASHTPGLITPRISWPSTAIDRPGSIVVSFTAGDPANCSRRVQNALLVWLDMNYHEFPWLESRRMAERIAAVVDGVTLHYSDFAGLTV